MNRRAFVQRKQASPAPSDHILQRKSACGNHTTAGREYSERATSRNNLQRKDGDKDVAESRPSLGRVGVMPSPTDGPACFARDFSQVPVHSGITSACSIQLVPAACLNTRRTHANAGRPAISTQHNGHQLATGYPSSQSLPNLPQRARENVARFATPYDSMQDEEKPCVEVAAPFSEEPVAESLASATESVEAERARTPAPDMPLGTSVDETRDIESELSYNPSITQSGSTNEFGETKPYTCTTSKTNITETKESYKITATVDHPITFQVNSRGKIDISSDTDPDITQENYATVVSDLTPDMNRLNGYPPRTEFWAEDLTIIHELFHAKEAQQFGQTGVIAAQKWLNKQPPINSDWADALVTYVPQKVHEIISAGMASPASEERAYGAGAASYLARATAIRRKGDAGAYDRSPATAPDRESTPASESPEEGDTQPRKPK